MPLHCTEDTTLIPPALTYTDIEWVEIWGSNFWMYIIALHIAHSKVTVHGLRYHTEHPMNYHSYLFLNYDSWSRIRSCTMTYLPETYKIQKADKMWNREMWNRWYYNLEDEKITDMFKNRFDWIYHYEIFTLALHWHCRRDAGWSCICMSTKTIEVFDVLCIAWQNRNIRLTVSIYSKFKFKGYRKSARFVHTMHAQNYLKSQVN